MENTYKDFIHAQKKDVNIMDKVQYVLNVVRLMAVPPKTITLNINEAIELDFDKAEQYVNILNASVPKPQYGVIKKWSTT